jgi:hypothetical protein
MRSAMTTLGVGDDDLGCLCGNVGRPHADEPVAARFRGVVRIDEAELAHAQERELLRSVRAGAAEAGDGDTGVGDLLLTGMAEKEQLPVKTLQVHVLAPPASGSRWFG